MDDIFYFDLSMNRGPEVESMGLEYSQELNDAFWYVVAQIADVSDAEAGTDPLSFTAGASVELFNNF